MTKPKPKRKKPGPVPRDRTVLVLRIDPDLAEWYTNAAAEVGRSRTNFMERALQAVAEVLQIVQREAGPAVEAGAVDLANEIGVEMVAALVRGDIAGQMVREGWRHRLDEQRKELGR